MSPSTKKSPPAKRAAPRSRTAPAGGPAATAEAVPEAVAAKPEGSGEGMKRLMAKGRAKGFLTYQDVNDALPDEVVSSEQIDDVLSMLGEEGIEVLDKGRSVDCTP